MRSRLPFDLPTVALLGAMLALFGGNVALYYAADWPWPVHVVLGTLAIHLSFTIWHEAVHRNAARDARWNDAIGVLGMLPYLAPFHLEKWLHLQHHALLNRPEDPNTLYADGPYWQMPLRYLRVLRFAKERLRDDPRTRAQRHLDRLPLALFAGTLAVAVRAGALVDLVILWLLPLALSKLVMDWYINWLPHTGLPPDRDRGTRILDIRWLTPLLLGHNYHAIHHLWPNLPWHRYRATFVERRAALALRGVPIETRLSGWPVHELDRRDPVAR
jgi:ring-1,2-phenylacetyl-CoA epoxidase subunit PaaE